MKFFKILTIIFVIGTLYALAYIGLGSGSIQTLITPQTQSFDTSKEVPLQQVNNLGYTFYVGQIDYKDAPIVSDEIKNEITKIVYNAHFPKNLLKNTPIIMVNSLATVSGQFIHEPGGDRTAILPELKPDFLSEGGQYLPYEKFSIIYINKSIIEKGQLGEVLTHELGHVIGSTLSNEDWKKYYQLRDIPNTTPQQSANWYLSPTEDFAEVYKNIFTGLNVKTLYGFLEPNNQGVLEIACRDTTDQNCRREVLTHPEKYPDDFRYAIPYTSVVGPKTKMFIETILSGLNKK